MQVFQKELGKRAGCIKTLKRSVRDLTKSSMADSRWLLEQMEELDGRWETICKLSISKQARLEDALRQVGLGPRIPAEGMIVSGGYGGICAFFDTNILHRRRSLTTWCAPFWSVSPMWRGL